MSDDYKDALLAAQLFIDYREMFALKRHGDFPPESKPAPPTKYTGQPPIAPIGDDHDDEQHG